MTSTGEDIVDLGDGVFGILSRPFAAPTKRTGVVIFNSGMLHRPGPFRLHVRLARRLAELGYPTLRFDFPGVGDSLPRATRPIVEITREIVERMQQLTGCAHFVVGGICSAADQGWQLALLDARVAGVLLVDGLARKGRHFVVGRLRRFLRKPRRQWLAFARRLVSKAPAAIETVENLRDWPPPGAERAELRALVERRVAIFALFTGGTWYFLHERQFQDTYGVNARSPYVEFHYWPQCDHMLYSEIDRAAFIDTFGQWMARRFPD